VANVKLFLLLFGVTQTVFVLLDFYELWRQDGCPSLPRKFRSEWRTFLSLAIIWLVYFSLQLGLSAMLPPVERILAAVRQVLGLSSMQMPIFSHHTALSIAIGCVTFFVAGFWDYLTHRFLLHSRLAWCLHESHHLPTKVFNGMPGISARPFVVFTAFLVNVFSIATMLLLFWIIGRLDLANLFFETLPPIIFVFAFIGSASHSCFLRRCAFFDRWQRYLWIITPQEHVLHHAANHKGNFGNFTPLWDRVFGTYLDPAKIGETKLGLNYDQDFLGAVTAGKWKLSARLRKKLGLERFCYQEDSQASESGPAVTTDSNQTFHSEVKSV
jgi:sterol desaturase/sphingolipid hydroxylase (fatty acid hydroxylase superfamily)